MRRSEVFAGNRSSIGCSCVMAPIDYSKFANIEDSDDEKPETSTSTPAKPAVTEKPSCSCCGKESGDLKRCTVCKKAWYCSQKCQREDWESHKRAYHGPQPKAKSAPEKRPPEAKAAEARRRKDEEEKVVDNDEEDIKWYKHREWKPTAEPKKEFKPTQLTGSAASEAVAAEATAKNPAAGSAWNAAGTWEEKDVTGFAKRSLQEKLAGWVDIDAAGGALSAEDVDSVDGEASKPVIRGKMRHMFDLNFKIKFTFKWMDSAGQRQASGSVEVSDFTDNVFAEGVDEKPAVKLSFGDARLLDEGRKQAVHAKIGAGAWPPEAGSLMAQAAAKMKAWVNDYEQAV